MIYRYRRYIRYINIYLRYICKIYIKDISIYLSIYLSIYICLSIYIYILHHTNKIYKIKYIIIKYKSNVDIYAAYIVQLKGFHTKKQVDLVLNLNVQREKHYNVKLVCFIFASRS